MLPFLIVGITSGSVYGLAGVGLVLTYKTSGIFNLAYGALAAMSAFLFYALHYQLTLPWPIAATVCVFILGPIVGIGFESFASGLSRTPIIWRITATVGILITIESIFTILYGSTERLFPNFLPVSTFEVFGTYVTYADLSIVSISAVSAITLFLFFRISRMGKAMRAVVDDSDLLDLAGTSPGRVRTWAWIIGTCFAMISGLLLAPGVGLSASGLTLLVVEAFGAAAIGKFTNLPLTLLGGIVIGIVSSLITEYVSSTSILGGLSESVPFIVLFVVLLLARRDRNAFREVAVNRRPSAWQTPTSIQVGGGALVLLFLLMVPMFAGLRLFAWTITLTYVILFLSLAFLARTSGQVSLCHVTFAAIGAVAFSKLLSGGVPWAPALFIAGLIAVPFGAILAIPAVRLSGLYLALATLGFGLLVQNMFYNSSFMFTISDNGVNLRTPHLDWPDIGSQDGYYYVVLFITLIAIAVIVGLTRSRLGRILRGISESSLAISTAGANVAVASVLVFCISAYLAAVAGGLGGVVLQQVTGADYSPLTSLSYLAVIMIVIGGAPWNAIAAALGIGLIPAYIVSSNTNNYLAAGFGLAAVTAALGLQNRLLSERARRRIEGWGRLISVPMAGGSDKPERGIASGRAASRDIAKPASLEVSGLGVRFGGLIAVNGLSLTAPPGQITGLIGPNGAGKTTTFNACSGLVRPSAGRIILNGADISGLGPSARARRGIGRTFQQVELLNTHTVLENIQMGCEARIAGRRLSSQLFSRRGDRDEIARRAYEAASLCGLDPILGKEAGLLSTGQKRLVELARCLAGQYGVLLLDEPSSGLDRTETVKFASILQAIVRDRGIGVLIVEHDMALVMNVCKEIYVMDFGTLIFHGSADDVSTSATVQSGRSRGSALA